MEMFMNSSHPILKLLGDATESENRKQTLFLEVPESHNPEGYETSPCIWPKTQESSGQQRHRTLEL